MAHRLRQPLPGAQPRLRFEMPPEQEDDDAPETETGTRFGNPGPRMSSQHPLYVGFMGTVGVGVALLVYWIGSNTTQLLLWIVAALFIALGPGPGGALARTQECPPRRRHRCSPSPPWPWVSPPSSPR